VDAWRLAAGIVRKSCPTEGEMVIYVGFTGNVHILADLGRFIADECWQIPQTIDTLATKADARFETDDEVDFADAIRNTVRQLHDFGILTPCMLTP